MEPWLQDSTYQKRIWYLTGFTACVWLGRYNQVKKIAIVTVSGALLDVGKTVDLAYEGNPIKAKGEKDLVPRLSQTMEWWGKEDPPTENKLPVGIDVPECLVDLGMAKDSTEVVKAVGDNALIVFYYFLQLREYTVKGKRNNTKQTAQLKL